MVERDRTTYTRLFEVRVLHHYWLDEDKTDLDELDTAIKEHRLLEYDVRSILRLEPSTSSLEIIRGLRGVFRTTGLGLVVAVPVDAVVPDDARFEFFVSPSDPAYANYTALTLRAMPIVDVVDPADPEVSHRFKERVPVLSNATGVSRGAGPGIRRFLSARYAAEAKAGDAAEALVTSGDALQMLTGDAPAPLADVGPAAKRPVFVHQGDAQPLVAPAGFVGVPATGIEMTPETPQDVVAVIRISPRPGEGTIFHIVNADGTPRTPSRVFEVHLRNRWTTWRYRDARTGAVTSTEADVLPLTRHGNAGAKRPPEPAGLAPETDPADPARIVRVMSDVYA